MGKHNVQYTQANTLQRHSLCALSRCTGRHCWRSEAGHSRMVLERGPVWSTAGLMVQRDQAISFGLSARHDDLALGNFGHVVHHPLNLRVQDRGNIDRCRLFPVWVIYNVLVPRGRRCNIGFARKLRLNIWVWFRFSISHFGLLELRGGAGLISVFEQY
jgi:hypothetical protein